MQRTINVAFSHDIVAGSIMSLPRCNTQAICPQKRKVIDMNGFLMVMMIGLSFSSFGVALAQSPEETTSTKRNREEFKDNLVNESTEDDEIRKLQLERLKSATLGAEVLKARSSDCKFHSTMPIPSAVFSNDLNA